jgi:hypothetical protein
MRESAPEVAAEVNERWKEKSINPNGSVNTKLPDAPFRCAVTRNLFNALPEEEQEAVQAKREYAKAMNDGPSKSPEARQKYVLSVLQNYLKC